MAYLTLVAAVPEDQVKAVRTNAAFVLRPTLIEGVSHLLGYWIQVQPLGHVLNLVIDGGDLLNESFWHPLRPPMVHDPQSVAQLTKDLTLAWSEVVGDPASTDEWLKSEMDRLLAIMNHAVDAGDCLVTALDFPADHERAKRVRIPWMPPSSEHGSPRRHWWMPWRRRK